MNHQQQISPNNEKKISSSKQPTQIPLSMQYFNFLHLLFIVNEIKQQSQQNNMQEPFQVVVYSKNIGYGPFSTKNLKKLNSIKQSQQYNSQIRAAVKCCVFLNLKCLLLNQLQLNNIEFLSFINVPLLQTLSISFNKIVNCKPLQKCYLPKLQFISFCNNQISHLSLERAKLPQKIINLSLSTNLRGRIILNDLSGLVKIQSKLIRQLEIRGDDKIRQKKLSNKLYQRFVFYHLRLQQEECIEIIQR